MDFATPPSDAPPRATNTPTSPNWNTACIRHPFAPAIGAPALLHVYPVLRRQLAWSNTLSQDAPLIAELDASYERVCVRHFGGDLAAHYHAASPVPPEAPRICPVTSQRESRPVTRAPDQTDELIVTGNHLLSVVPQALCSLASSPSTAADAISAVRTSLAALRNLGIPINAGLVSQVQPHGFRSALRRWPDRRAPHNSPINAAFGRCASIRALSVPPAWRAALVEPGRMVYKVVV